jgi:hypothetical protein
MREVGEVICREAGGAELHQQRLRGASRCLDVVVVSSDDQRVRPQALHE